MTKERAKKSPWQKYNKKRHVYSPLYQMWREEALTRGAGTDKAIALACQHARMMRLAIEACVVTAA